MNKNDLSHTVEAAGSLILRLVSWPGYVAAWLFPILVAVVVFGVIGAAMGLNDLLAWDFRLPLFGDRLTLTGVSELQWHIFALIVTLSAAYALARDRHVRVDILSGAFKPSTRLWIDVIGDLFLLLPFYGLLFWFSLTAAQTAFAFGEQSNSGGLVDRYLIKAALPLGSAVMFGGGIGRILRNLGLLLQQHPGAASPGKDGS